MRRDPELGARYRTLLSSTGYLLALCGLLQLVPLLALIAWPREAHTAPAFLVPGLALAAVGLLLGRLLRPRPARALSVTDGGIVVLAGWVVVTLVSALPFQRILGLSFSQACFESVSGWTTTGLSVVDVERAPHVILLWRSLMQLAGGAGMAILLITLAGGPLGPGLATAEGRSDQLVPHVRRSARLVLTIYTGLAAAGVFAMWSAGMSGFDALNHAFAAVSTGGFSTRSASIGHFDSIAVEVVTLPLMILGSTNFQVTYLLLRGRLRPVLRNPEVRTFALLTGLVVPLLLILVTMRLHPESGRAVRVAIFEGVSALTTTGFSLTSYTRWPPIGILLLILLMLVGGATGSTAGALKQFRVYLLVKAAWWEVQRLCRPIRAVLDTSIWQGEERVPIPDRRVAQVAAFATLYVVTLILGTSVMVAYGYGLQASLFEYASALGTVGLSVGVTSASTPAPVLWAEIGGMLLGRLEILIVFVALHRLVADGASLLGARRA
jgi:trk system potassium uptake protein TrkH